MQPDLQQGQPKPATNPDLRDDDAHSPGEQWELGKVIDSTSSLLEDAPASDTTEDDGFQEYLHAYTQRILGRTPPEEELPEQEPSPSIVAEQNLEEPHVSQSVAAAARKAPETEDLLSRMRAVANESASAMIQKHRHKQFAQVARGLLVSFAGTLLSAYCLWQTLFGHSLLYFGAIAGTTVTYYGFTRCWKADLRGIRLAIQRLIVLLVCANLAGLSAGGFVVWRYSFGPGRSASTSRQTTIDEMSPQDDSSISGEPAAPIEGAASSTAGASAAMSGRIDEPQSAEATAEGDGEAVEVSDQGPFPDVTEVSPVD